MGRQVSVQLKEELFDHQSYGKVDRMLPEVMNFLGPGGT